MRRISSRPPPRLAVVAHHVEGLSGQLTMEWSMKKDRKNAETWYGLLAVPVRIAAEEHVHAGEPYLREKTGRR